MLEDQRLKVDLRIPTSASEQNFSLNISCQADDICYGHAVKDAAAPVSISPIPPP